MALLPAVVAVLLVGSLVWWVGSWFGAGRALRKPVGGTVLITGAASGLGRALSKQLAQDSTCRLILVDINGEKVKGLVAKLGPTHQAVAADVRSETLLRALAAQYANEPIKYIIGNAGICHGKAFEQLQAGEVRATVETNFLAQTFLLRHFAPILHRNSGRFVAVASAAGLFSLSRLSDYVASKFALVGWFESLRLELRRNKASHPSNEANYGISLMLPFLLDTKMFKGVKISFPASLILSKLNKNAVATRIIQAMKGGEEFVVMPSVVRVTPLLLVLPVWVRNLVYDFIGEASYMDSFQGRGETWASTAQ